MPNLAFLRWFSFNSNWNYIGKQDFAFLITFSICWTKWLTFWRLSYTYWKHHYFTKFESKITQKELLELFEQFLGFLLKNLENFCKNSEILLINREFPGNEILSREFPLPKITGIPGFSRSGNSRETTLLKIH